MSHLPFLAVLGGEKTIGHPIDVVFDLVKVIREGLPYDCLMALCRETGYFTDQVEQFLRITHRTMIRRCNDGRFDPQESERLIRLARVYMRAVEHFGTKREAKEWLGRENPALANEPPISYLDTDIGYREVSLLIDRLPGNSTRSEFAAPIPRSSRTGL